MTHATMPWPWPKGCPECASMWAAECRSCEGGCRMVCPECNLEGPVRPTWQECTNAWNQMAVQRKADGKLGATALARIAQRRALKAAGKPHDLGSWLEYNFGKAKA